MMARLAKQDQTLILMYGTLNRIKIDYFNEDLVYDKMISLIEDRGMT